MKSVRAYGVTPVSADQREDGQLVFSASFQQVLDDEVMGVGNGEPCGILRRDADQTTSVISARQPDRSNCSL